MSEGCLAESLGARKKSRAKARVGIGRSRKLAVRQPSLTSVPQKRRLRLLMTFVTSSKAKCMPVQYIAGGICMKDELTELQSKIYEVRGQKVMFDPFARASGH